MYTLKAIARRATLLGAAFALAVSTVTPFAPAAFADALNPLTNRSLTLSSSSPGWAYTDGSNNTTYAPANSGANGQKTGNYFDFKVSSSDTVRTMSFQYCTTPAGQCTIPGNGALNVANQTSDLDINYPTATEISSFTPAGTGTLSTVSGSDEIVGVGTSFTSFVKIGDTIRTFGGNSYVVEAVEDNTHLTITANAAATEAGVTYTKIIVNSATGAVQAVPDSTGTANFLVMTESGGTWTQSTGWTVAAHNVATTNAPGGATDNYITITKPAGEALTSGQQVKVLFFATNSNYITNPGAGAFFVKINTYDVSLGEDREDYDGLEIGDPGDDALTGTFDLTDLAPVTDEYIIDGGVTVANVMNQSIQITTKVLETMQFSVGTVDPNTLDSDSTGGPSEMDVAYGSAQGVTKHTPCDTILKGMSPTDPENVLQLGDQTAESSLSTTATYSTRSYWRLSSNSSAGATVYYSGHTLSNTVGDEIDPIGPTKLSPAKGAEQFGLALANTSNPSDADYATDVTALPPIHQNFSVSYAQEAPYENGADNGKTSIHTTSLTADNVLSNSSWHTPRLYPLVAEANYNDGTGSINTAPTTQFAFNPASDTVPVALATQNSQVVDCVTGKMRYIANIAATTPAGIYTTKINYIAAPQY